jgi:hypothetical protein
VSNRQHPRGPDFPLASPDRPPMVLLLRRVNYQQQGSWLAAACRSNEPDRRRPKTDPTRRRPLIPGRFGKLHNPGSVTLWESPRTAWGLPMAMRPSLQFVVKPAHGFLVRNSSSGILRQFLHSSLEGGYPLANRSQFLDPAQTA